MSLSFFRTICAAAAVGSYIPPPLSKPVYTMAIIGNSIMAGYMGPPTIASKYFPPERVTAGCLAVNFAVAGHTISAQKATWAAYVGDKSVFDAVYIQIGINDVLLSGETDTSYYVGELQSLIDDVNADIREDAKIFVAVMTPCRGYMDDNLSPENADAMYQLWKDVNEAYLNETQRDVVEGTPIDLYVTANRDALIEGDGFLKPSFDNGDGIHLNESPGQDALIEGMQSEIDPYMASL